MHDGDRTDHWLARPATIRLLWRVFIAVLVTLVALQAVVKIKGYFAVDAWFGFGAAFGFVSCVAMVLVAKALGFAIKRPEDYYAGDDDGA